MKIATLSLILKGWVRWDVVGVKREVVKKEGRRAEREEGPREEMKESRRWFE